MAIFCPNAAMFISTALPRIRIYSTIFPLRTALRCHDDAISCIRFFYAHRADPLISRELKLRFPPAFYARALIFSTLSTARP